MEFWWAEVDRALGEAYRSDPALSGSISLVEFGTIPKPGNSVDVNFMDSTIKLKVLGYSLTVSADDDDISCVLSVKKPLR